jgi:hypothetical protein
MLRKKIAYDGFDGKSYEEEFCFHITEADIAKMELGATREGGFEALIRKIVDTTDGKKLVELFEDLILMSVGELAPDGKRFVKSDVIRDNFKNSNAYSKLFLELVTETDKGVEFVNGIVPQALREQRALSEATDKVANRPEPVADATPAPSVTTDIRPASPAKEEKDDRPAWLKEGRTPTSEELRGATSEQIQEAFRRRGAQQPDPESISAG